MNAENDAGTRWYEGITRYQYFVLLIACLGWIMDIFEGQLFAVFKSPAFKDLLNATRIDDPNVATFGYVGFALFLVGGTVGGIFFGALADRIGRSRRLSPERDHAYTHASCSEIRS